MKISCRDRSLLPSPRSGFTFVEMGIVLVIVALVTAGVLVGKDMLESAEARSLMSQLDKFQAASRAFEIKYNCKAGDCAKASSLSLGLDGNGDGLNGGAYGTGTTTWPVCLRGGTSNGCMTDRNVSGNIWTIGRSYGEHQQFWVHLSAAGLIKETINSIANNQKTNIDQILDTTYPKDALDKHYLVAAMWNRKMYIRTGLDTVTSDYGETHFSTSAALSSAQAYYITSKFGYPAMSAASTPYPPALVAGQRVVPIAANTSAQYFFYLRPHYEAAGTAPACLVSDGGSGYVYNIEAGGRCDLLWEIDY